MIQTTSDSIFDFIVSALRLSGSPYNTIGRELIMAQCQVEVPRNFFRAAHLELLNLQMVCDPTLLSKYPGAELVSKGSHRLQWFINGIRERGQVIQITTPYTPDPVRTGEEILSLLPGPPYFAFGAMEVYYHPELLVNFKVSFETDEKSEELYSLSINLTNGMIGADLLSRLENCPVTPGHPPKFEKRKISYKDGFTTLYQHLRWLLRNHDSGWLESAKNRWRDEVGYLESYFQENPEINEGDENSFYRQLADLYRKAQPVIRIHICNVGLIYLPMVLCPLRMKKTPSSVKLPPIVYDPVRRRVNQGSG